VLDLILSNRNVCGPLIKDRQKTQQGSFLDGNYIASSCISYAYFTVGIQQMFTNYRGNAEIHVFICGEMFVYFRSVSPIAEEYSHQHQHDRALLGGRKEIFNSICSGHNWVLKPHLVPHPASRYSLSLNQMLFASDLSLVLERCATPLCNSEMAKSSSGKTSSSPSQEEISF
jgi:hypothetical protein